MIAGPIILIDDDRDDLNFLKDALCELKVRNKIVEFEDAENALDFFKTAREKPFLVLCDMNMPRLDGLTLRDKIYKDSTLRMGSFPFLFLSTGGGYPTINNAYDLYVQGYFIKPSSMDKIEEMLRSIISYWTFCQHPRLV